MAGKILYSPARRGFFHSDVHGDKVPPDVVEISHEEWRDLLDKQSQGHEIVHTDQGVPFACERVVTDEQKAAWLRADRNAALAATDGDVARHRDQHDSDEPTTLTADQFKALLAYRNALRDLPKQQGFPNIELPSRNS
jgi:hypothetical protein